MKVQHLLWKIWESLCVIIVFFIRILVQVVGWWWWFESCLIKYIFGRDLSLSLFPYRVAKSSQSHTKKGSWTHLNMTLNTEIVISETAHTKFCNQQIFWGWIKATSTLSLYNYYVDSACMHAWNWHIIQSIDKNAM